MILLHNSFFSLFSCVISSTFINFGWRLKFIIQQLATILELLHKIEKKKIFVCIWEWAQLYTNVAQINVFIFNKMLLRKFFNNSFILSRTKYAFSSHLVYSAFGKPRLVKKESVIPSLNMLFLLLLIFLNLLHLVFFY